MIVAAFDRNEDRWVALAEIDWVNDRDFDFGTARVIGHGSRREQYEQARPWRAPTTRIEPDDQARRTG